MRLLVCGGRDFDDHNFVHNTLCAIHAERGPVSCIIHGATTRVDYEGMIWAQMMGIKHLPMVPDWHSFGKAAGALRNQRMVDIGKPDLVMAFSGGRGTDDMKRRARAANIKVIEAKP